MITGIIGALVVVLLFLLLFLVSALANRRNVEAEARKRAEFYKGIAEINRIGDLSLTRPYIRALRLVKTARKLKTH